MLVVGVLCCGGVLHHRCRRDKYDDSTKGRNHDLSSETHQVQPTLEESWQKGPWKIPQGPGGTNEDRVFGSGTKATLEAGGDDLAK